MANPCPWKPRLFDARMRRRYGRLLRVKALLDNLCEETRRAPEQGREGADAPPDRGSVTLDSPKP
jgi:hypothetical protein